MARTTIPCLLWDTGFAKQLDFGYPLDNAISYPMPRDGSEWGQAPSGYEDSWDEGTDEMLEGDLRWIPTTDTVSPPQTGWDGASGVAAFLKWARLKNIFRLCPDRTNLAVYWPMYLVEPMKGKPDSEADMTRRLHLIMRTSDGSAITGY